MGRKLPFQIQYFKVKEQTKIQMQNRVLNDNELGQESVLGKERFYRIRAKMGKIEVMQGKSSSKYKQKRLNRMNSYSPRRNKPNFALLFKQARLVKSCQTYLQNRGQNKFIPTKEPLTPKVFTIRHIKNTGSANEGAKLKRLPTNTNHEELGIKKQNNIYKTIQIRIDGKEFNMQNKERLITTLSQIILNQSLNKGNLTIQIDESLIAANQQNCFGQSDVLLIGQMMQQTT